MTIISCINILTSFLVLMVFLPYQLDAYYTLNTGCHHNGTWYADNSLVPTTEKCLNCQCNKKTLVCRLKVCPEMPMPPPRGCVIVQKKNTCCPYLSCARLDAFYRIPATRRIIAYLDHYERESIDRAVKENMLQGRSDDTDVDLYVCVKNGTVYKSGSAMSSSNLCSYCYCIGGTEKCVKPKCMLPVERCKPIFVDSTCCPVRYDCSTKQTGKSSQEVRYRKTSNKHYLRMSQSLQRNRGCTVGQQFYAEGQKMKSDKDKPCDVCFCIRGQRKCAPKKCAPSLRNCIPVVPKGQCCPSSYDCGSQRDYRRSQNSRQFNLYSLFFGKNEDQDENAATEIPIYYPHDRDPLNIKPVDHKTVKTEKSIFESIREGLEFIDNNNKQMLKENENLIPDTNHARPSPTPIPMSSLNTPSTTEISFLDLLLRPSESNDHKKEDSFENTESIEEQTTPTSNILNWMNLLLTPDDEDNWKDLGNTISDKIDKTNPSNAQNHTNFENITSIDRVDKDNTIENEKFLGKLNDEEQEKLLTTTLDSITTEDLIMNEETTEADSTILAETTEEINFSEPIKISIKNTTKKSSTTTSTATTTLAPTTTSTSKKPLKTTTVQNKIKTQPSKPVSELFKNTTYQKPNKNSDFLAQLLGGLSDIWNGENKTHINNQMLNLNKTTTVKLPTPQPMPLFKPLPLNKTYTRINSKIANLTIQPPIISTKGIMKTTFISLPSDNKNNTSKPVQKTKEILKSTTSKKPKVTISTTSTTTSTSTTTTTTSTLKPVVIKTNPTILEAELFDENVAPTLPPSLPNLKIIPFLPTDAVKSDHNPSLSYDFYHHSSAPISRTDYDLYDDGNLYPSITEKYPLYPDLEDGSKAEYIYKFNVEGPDSLVSSNAGKFDGTLGSPAFLKYDFAGSGTSTAMKGFSPPTKTEGGFIPKEPLMLDNEDHDNVSVRVGDSYHVSQHIIDITTSSANILNTTKIIEITTPDPFKDVIHTEPPPDLTSLIEDKLKNFNIKSNLKTITTTSQSHNNKLQNRPQIEVHSKQTNKNAMNTKIQTEIKITMTATPKTNNNNDYDIKNGTSQTEDVGEKSLSQHVKTIGHGIVDEANVDINDVTTMSTFNILPTAAQVVQQQLISSNATSSINANLESITSAGHMKLRQKQTTTMAAPITTMTTKSPITFKVNRNKTITTTNHGIQQIQQAQRPLKTKNPVGGTKILASSTSTSISTSSFGSVSSSSSSYSSTSGGSLSTMKTKSNPIRRVASTKPTKYNKTITNTTTISTATATIKNDTTANAINNDTISVATRRTVKPTANVNTQPVTQSKITAETVVTTTKPFTTARIRTTPSRSTIQQTKIQTTKPFFMSPFDKLPFLNASFEIKRTSATTSPTTTTNTTPQQYFAVHANIADADQDVDSDSSSSSKHKLMGLVHYKYTLNQLEGLEPSAKREHLQHSPLSTTQLSQMSSPLSSSSSTSSSSPSTSSLNNLIDPIGILKLAGCNIYGRMYRVGRIIIELSSPCLECKCTEIGVKCTPLDC